jgi:hypothetical protein
MGSSSSLVSGNWIGAEEQVLECDVGRSRPTAITIAGWCAPIVYGEPIMVDRHAEVDEALRSRVADALDVAEQRTWAILNSHSTLPTAPRRA